MILTPTFLLLAYLLFGFCLMALIRVCCLTVDGGAEIPRWKILAYEIPAFLLLVAFWPFFCAFWFWVGFKDS